MINEIRPGMVLRLPSGNEVTVLRLAGFEWACQYTERARARGEVIFSAAFLHNWAKRA